MNPLEWIKWAPWLISAALALALAGMTGQYLHKRDELTELTASVRVLGEAAEKRATATRLADKQRKDHSDAEHQIAIAALNADIKRLRNNRSLGGGLSAPAPSPASPDRICFDPSKLNAALRILDEGILGIAESGSAAIIGLDAAKEWGGSIMAREQAR